jgi:hypothetical protein
VNRHSFCLGGGCSSGIYSGIQNPSSKVLFSQNLLWLGGGEEDVGFEVLTVMAMKSSVLWDITQCSPMSQLTFRSNISFPRFLPASCWLLVSLIFLPWRLRRYIPPKRRLTSTELHGIISQEPRTIQQKEEDLLIKHLLYETCYIFSGTKYR